MKVTAETYQQMKTATLKLLIEVCGVQPHVAVDLVQGAEANAYQLIIEQDDDENLVEPWVDGDHTSLADRFVGSIYGGCEYHLKHREKLENWGEIYEAVEACAEAVLRVKGN